MADIECIVLIVQDAGEEALKVHHFCTCAYLRPILLSPGFK